MLAILTTHPIQYQVPIWKALAARGRVPVKVYYMSNQGIVSRHDPGFGRPVAWDIDLLSGYDHEFLPGIVERENSSTFFWLRANSNIARRLVEQRATTLWIQGWQVLAYWQAVWQAKSEKLTTWLRAESNLSSIDRSWKRYIKDPARRQLFNRIDRFLCIGEANRCFYEANGIELDRLVSAPYCVDNSRFERDATALAGQRAEIRRKWNIPDKALCVLFVGKLIPKKRPADLISACQVASHRLGGRHLHLLFVGAGELIELLRSQTLVVYDFEHKNFPRNLEAPPSSRQITASFAGFLNQSEIVQAYVAADCLVLPSEATETWGLVVNEAMACGLPAVVSDAVGCCADLVRPLRPDLCFPVGDIRGLAESLTACLINPPRPEDIRSIIDKYDVLRTVEAVEELYRETACNRAA